MFNFSFNMKSSVKSRFQQKINLIKTNKLYLTVRKPSVEKVKSNKIKKNFQ